MGRISIFGISGSGKTCYLYAMYYLFMNQGINLNSNVSLSLLLSNNDQRRDIEGGYDRMIQKGEWPQGTDLAGAKDYEFQVRFAYKDGKMPFCQYTYVTISDYAGGWWKQDQNKREKLLSSFVQSAAILCFIDGEVLLKAMPDNDVDPDHREGTSVLDTTKARQDIGYVENMLADYKKQGEGVPPVLVTVTKADVFASDKELERAKAFLRQQLPSLFAKGSGVEAGLTAVSLGVDLGNEDDAIIGRLDPSMEHNLHVPVVFGYYAWLSQVYNEKNPQDEMDAILSRASAIRDSMKGKVDIYKSGETLFAL